MKKIFQPTDCLSKDEIDFYTKDKVSAEMRYKIENHMVDCPLCAEAVEGYMTMNQSSDDLFDEVYQKIDSKISGKNKRSIKGAIPWNRIAAGLLFMISIGAAYLFYQNDPSNDYRSFFGEDKQLFANRAIEENRLPADMAAGLKLYQQKEYQGSLSFFEDYLILNPESAEAAYYAGISAKNIGEPGQAFDYLSAVRLNSDFLYEEATWLLSGIYLERGERKEAKRLLQEIVSAKNGFYKDEATKLLKELE